MGYMRASKKNQSRARTVGIIKYLLKSLSALWEKKGTRYIMTRLTKKKVKITETEER